MGHSRNSDWRRHYWKTVGSLSGCDTRLAKSLSEAEMAIFKRLQEIQHSPDHAPERNDLTKAVDGLLLIKTVVLGWPGYKHDESHAA
jgi:hypothetical protein